MGKRIPFRLAAPAAAALLAMTVHASPGTAQIGAIGAVPGVPEVDGSFAGTPIFGSSAAVLPLGGLSVGAHFASVSQSVSIQGTDVDMTVSQMLAGVSYSPMSRLMIGVSASPYISLEASSQFGAQEQSGHGDAFIDARYQAWQAPGGRTQIAANATLQLPVGDDFFGAAGSAVGLGAAASHQLEQLSLHGGVGVRFPMNEADGQTSVSFNGAGVMGVSPRVWLSLEMLGVNASGDYVVNLAPGVRVGLGRQLFLDAAALLKAAASEGTAPFDHAVVLGISFVR
jgi:hypothetical protein